jgi:hypothetical protein
MISPNDRFAARTPWKRRITQEVGPGRHDVQVTVFPVLLPQDSALILDDTTWHRSKATWTWADDITAD